MILFSLYTGCGNFSLGPMSVLPDPCPLPDKTKRRSLNEKEKLIFAPMSGVGGIVYDKDAVYIELGGSHAHKGVSSAPDELLALMGTKHTLDAKMKKSQVSIFRVGFYSKLLLVVGCCCCCCLFCSTQ